MSSSRNITTAVPLPSCVRNAIDGLALGLLNPPGSAPMDFTRPIGEPSLTAHDSMSWEIFKNPVAMFVGGVAAVILELAEPRVRTGVWEHSTFRAQPMLRLQRTGLAAMVTVYGARSVAERMIAGVVRRHGQVTGFTPAGERYEANDVDLLTWVQATAGFGFAQAFHAYVRPLRQDELDRFYLEGAPAARLYGALHAPTSEAGMRALFDRTGGRLESSPIVFEFLDILGEAPILPAPLRPVQRLLIRAAVEITPGWVRERLGLTSAQGLGAMEARFVRWAGALADRIVLARSPAVQACRRLGLPADYLYRRSAR
ncbi:oxygenase MpaB family protein [Variovorax sp. J22R24]|uniref:oxygenase MpaB family protein n=1 Tax=Variovorax gracilis TaxID=3053502 RepID=UPI00257505BF|nr:oxygenase MpaB family protein [Variovorax sp. J22R24]MDM0109964.1 oxygenase MpaB family protein [Variovorax sp. J22R24]